MIPVEFSYLKMIFGKTGQGSYFSRLPLKCRELLSYLSVHFFMDKEEQMIPYGIRPAIISAGNSVEWIFKCDPEAAISSIEEFDISTNTLFKLSNLLKIKSIVKYFYFTISAGEVEIKDPDRITNVSTTDPLNHCLMIAAKNPDRMISGYSIPDAVRIRHRNERNGQNRNRSNLFLKRKRVNHSLSDLLKKINRWLYFLNHHHFDRISPPGYLHHFSYHHCTEQSGVGIRAGPGRETLKDGNLKDVWQYGFSARRVIREGLIVPTVMVQCARNKINDRPYQEG